MIIRLSLPAICVFFLYAVVTSTAHNSLVQSEHLAISDLQQACPTIYVLCDEFTHGEPLTFTAELYRGNPNVVPIYNWTVSAGKIIQGQGAPSIKVDTAGFGGQAFTATVSVAGFDLACPATASCSIFIEHLPNSIRFDSYGTLPRKNETTRLNAFAVQLQQEPGAQGYLLVYGGRSGRAGEAQKLATRSQEYLVKSRSIDAGRIVTVDGGFKEKLTIDLWVVPTGANAPVADPTVDPSEVKTTRRKPSKH